jgi:uncharacterized membrane protein YagU involved in acid resistance
MILPLTKQLVRGLVAGTVATVPMTVVMLKLHHWPYPERDSLPPEQITQEIAAQTGIKKYLNGSQQQALTIASHFGYGAGTGALYSLLFARLPVHRVAKGAIWGIIVWAVSYLGWLPAADILPPATEHSKRRNWLMIISHLVWGVSTAYLAEKESN